MNKCHPSISIKTTFWDVTMISSQLSYTVAIFSSIPLSNSLKFNPQSFSPLFDDLLSFF